MVIWGQAVRVRPAAGCVGGAIGNRLSPTVRGLSPAAKGLSPSAKTCHDLPRVVSSLSGFGRQAIRRTNEAWRGCPSMSLVRLRLGQIECSARPELRSAASDLLLEKDVEGHSRPVTVCHIEAACRRGFDGIEDGQRPALNKNADSSASSGLCGSFRDRSPGRCPGLRWGTPFGARQSEEIPVLTDVYGLPASIAVGHDLQSRNL